MAGTETDELLQDIHKATKRAREARGLDLRHELYTNIYPLFEALVERVKETEDVVAEYLMENGSVVQTDLAAQIFSVFDLGKQMGIKLTALANNDVEVKKLVEAFTTAADLAANAVEEALIDEDDLEDDEEEDDEEEDDDDEEEDDDINDEEEGEDEDDSAAKGTESRQSEGSGG